MIGKIKLLTITLTLIITLSLTFAFATEEANAGDDTCAMFVPAYNECIWHPINCLCPIIVEAEKE